MMPYEILIHVSPPCLCKCAVNCQGPSKSWTCCTAQGLLRHQRGLSPNLVSRVLSGSDPGRIVVSLWREVPARHRLVLPSRCFDLRQTGLKLAGEVGGCAGLVGSGLFDVLWGFLFWHGGPTWVVDGVSDWRFWM